MAEASAGLCVAGTQTPTNVLKDGQRITVDGAKGVVRIED
jgi:phosphohistidine swiveling domain-containing protein